MIFLLTNIAPTSSAAPMMRLSIPGSEMRQTPTNCGPSLPIANFRFRWTTFRSRTNNPSNCRKTKGKDGRQRQHSQPSQRSCVSVGLLTTLRRCSSPRRPCSMTNTTRCPSLSRQFRNQSYHEHGLQRTTTTWAGLTPYSSVLDIRTITLDRRRVTSFSSSKQERDLVLQ